MRISCFRCGGLLVRERLFEVNDMSSTEQVECARCVNCGTLEDHLIRANRQPTRPPVRAREPRGPRIRQDTPPSFLRQEVTNETPSSAALRR